jgi:hypothetical protein
VQVSDAGRLQLVHQITVPSRCPAGVPEVGLALLCLQVRPDDSDPELTRDLWDLRLERRD